MTDESILVVPDVHGRTFWKSVKGFDGQIVFLGDYHDPYPWDFAEPGEWWPTCDYNRRSIKNMKELFRFADENQNRVTLLLGNHDMAYIAQNYDASRKDYLNENELRALYNEYKPLFRGCKVIGNTIFTHAGISNEWYNEMLLEHPELDRKNIESNVNTSILNQWKCILDASPIRGGDREFAGPLWMDYNELLDKTVRPLDNGMFQIFGHTQQEITGNVVSADNWASIDSRCVFEINPMSPLKSQHSDTEG